MFLGATQQDEAYANASVSVGARRDLSIATRNDLVWESVYYLLGLEELCDGCDASILVVIALILSGGRIKPIIVVITLTILR